jgi:hypothetical protein
MARGYPGVERVSGAFGSCQIVSRIHKVQRNTRNTAWASVVSLIGNSTDDSVGVEGKTAIAITVSESLIDSGPRVWPAAVIFFGVINSHETHSRNNCSHWSRQKKKSNYCITVQYCTTVPLGTKKEVVLQKVRGFDSVNHASQNKASFVSVQPIDAEKERLCI